MTRARRAVALLTAVLFAAPLAACAGGAGNSTAGGNATQGTGKGADQETLTVFAAASLKTSFTELAERFGKENPGTSVTLSFAGSADLATQISQGAPADVFASADDRNMAKLQDAGLVDGDPRDFATNTLAIAVQAGNPAGIGSFADLARSGTKLVMCARQVPCGAAAAAVEQQTGTDLSPVSEENSVADVLGKVTSGEADAGLVYVTDVRAAGGKVENIPFPEAAGAVNTYPIATLAGSRHKAAAAKFLELVTGPGGREILAAAGFGPGR
ncbi:MULTISPECIES: molybdate ABC transporter substrate-binding protein [unclassified Arthrobacter]|uniref:molybdate ABC transporter substrate-binding protein n=1 Tax=unclassified Arthrobacter TaxID=235627 RepID=UPI001F1059A1|nr:MULTISPECIES: molybdate ABC transporter substrate-binding protein [unclassified Arthrobacter]